MSPVVVYKGNKPMASSLTVLVTDNDLWEANKQQM